jgi:hypothetical protein
MVCIQPLDRLAIAGRDYPTSFDALRRSPSRARNPARPLRSRIASAAFCQLSQQWLSKKGALYAPDGGEVIERAWEKPAADTGSKEEASAPHELNGVRHAASVKLHATGLQRPRVLTVKIELMSACGT